MPIRTSGVCDEVRNVAQMLRNRSKRNETAAETTPTPRVEIRPPRDRMHTPARLMRLAELFTELDTELAETAKRAKELGTQWTRPDTILNQGRAIVENIKGIRDKLVTLEENPSDERYEAYMALPSGQQMYRELVVRGLSVLTDILLFRSHIVKIEGTKGEETPFSPAMVEFNRMAYNPLSLESLAVAFFSVGGNEDEEEED